MKANPSDFRQKWNAGPQEVVAKEKAALVGLVFFFCVKTQFSLAASEFLYFNF